MVVPPFVRPLSYCNQIRMLVGNDIGGPMCSVHCTRNLDVVVQWPSHAFDRTERVIGESPRERGQLFSSPCVLARLTRPQCAAGQRGRWAAAQFLYARTHYRGDHVQQRRSS